MWLYIFAVQENNWFEETKTFSRFERNLSVLVNFKPVKGSKGKKLVMERKCPNLKIFMHYPILFLF